MAKQKRSRLLILSMIALVVLLALFVASIIRIVSVNQALPTPARVEHAQGEKMVGGGLAVSVLNATLYDDDQIEGMLPGYLDAMDNLLGETTDKDDTKLIIVELEITNESAEDIKFNFRSLVLQSNVWHNGVDYTLFGELNADETDDTSTIKGNSSKKLKLPYCLYAMQFKNSRDWQNIENRQYDLVISVYPAYHIVHLNKLNFSK